ncbi:unnamed protein product [Aspergillus oryzae]|nr:unnamed protein product [Aspergillus oryzae]
MNDPKMSLLILPIELLRLIATFLKTEKDLNSLCQTNTWLYSVLNRFLYQQNIRISGESALIWAAKFGKVVTAQILIQEGVNVGMHDTNGMSPLLYAAAYGHLAVAELLVQEGAELESKNWQSQTPLSSSAAHGHEAVVKLLLEKGANPVYKNRHG